jgi:4-amino-4-deoxy-L-arabinose transferase-like glycosyltransferase
MTRPRILTATLVLALVAAFVLLTVGSAARESATYDEPAHLAAGYSYWHVGDYRMNPEHPPLLKLLAAFPLLWQSVQPTNLATEDGLSTHSTSSRALQLAWALGLSDDRSQWYWSHHWLYGASDQAFQRLGVTNPFAIPGSAALTSADFVNDADRLLFWGRLPMALLGALLALLVFGWARELFGSPGGLLALTMFCFDPSFIAHAGLVTTDVGVAVFMFGTMYFLWRCHRRTTVPDVVLLAVFFGLALASKFTAILLVPVVLLVTAIAMLAARRKQPLPGARHLLRGAGVLVMVGAVAYGLLWATYGFRYSAARDPAAASALEVAAARQLGLQLAPNPQPGHLPLESVLKRSAELHRRQEMGGAAAAPEASNLPDVVLPLTGRLLLLASRWHLLPEAYLFGFAYAEMRSLSRGSFLLGRYSDRGWWYYFPVAFLLKTPTVSLLLIAAAIVYLGWRKREDWLDWSFLLVPVLAYVLVSLRSHLNIGHRHLLPIYPFLFVCCGSLGLIRLPPVRRFVGPAVLSAIALNGFVVFAPLWRPALTYPHFLAYFNELAGGPRAGYTRLADSSLDWGQELKSLKHWLEVRGIREPIKLCYFGTADPRYYQIAHVNLPGGYLFEPETPWERIDVSGYFAVSATCLDGVYQSPQTHLALKRVLAEATLVDTLGYSLFIYRHD